MRVGQLKDRIEEKLAQMKVAWGGFARLVPHRVERRKTLVVAPDEQRLFIVDIDDRSQTTLEDESLPLGAYTVTGSGVIVHIAKQDGKEAAARRENRALLRVEKGGSFTFLVLLLNDWPFRSGSF